MTLPCERTRSVVRTRDFLTRLVSPYLPDGLKRIPKPVRQEALRLLRHYPSVVDMKYAAESFCPEEAERIMDEREPNDQT
jgi:hypothetical protein